MSYEIGKVYVWQNQVGECAYLNGTGTGMKKLCSICGAPKGVAVHKNCARVIKAQKRLAAIAKKQLGLK